MRNNPSRLPSDFVRCYALCELEKYEYRMTATRRLIRTGSRVMGQIHVAIVTVMFLVAVNK